MLQPSTHLARRPIVLGYAVLALLVALYAGAPVFTNDVFWHVATGDHLLATGVLGGADPFSYTAAERPWFLHEWLTQVLFAGIFALGGWPGIRAATAGMAVAIMVLLFWIFRRESSSDRAALGGALLFLVLGADQLQARPTLFTIAFTLLLCGHLLRRGALWTWRDAALATLLTLVWVNMHSVGLIALGMYGAWFAGAVLERRRAPRPIARHATTLAAMAVVSLATPSGAGLWGFALQDKRDVMQYVSDEWAPFHLLWSANESLRPEAYVAILAVLALLVVVYFTLGIALQRTPRERRPWPDAARTLLLAALLIGGLSARRFHWMLVLVVLFSLLALRDLHRAGALATIASLGRRPAARIAGSVALAMLAVPGYAALRIDGVGLHTLLRNDYGARLSAPFRMAGVELLRASGMRGNLFCHYGSGGLLLHRLLPDLKVFIDSRIDLYGREIYLDWVAIRDGRPDQLALLDRYGTDVYYRHWDLSPPRDPHAWHRIYSGCDGEIYLRRGRPLYDENLAKWQRAHGATPGH